VNIWVPVPLCFTSFPSWKFVLQNPPHLRSIVYAINPFVFCFRLTSLEVRLFLPLPRLNTSPGLLFRSMNPNFFPETPPTPRLWGIESFQAVEYLPLRPRGEVFSCSHPGSHFFGLLRSPPDLDASFSKIFPSPAFPYRSPSPPKMIPLLFQNFCLFFRSPKNFYPPNEHYLG